MNQVNLTGKIMQLTLTGSSDKPYALGRISVYRRMNDDGTKQFDYIPFIMFGSQVPRLEKGAIVGLSGSLQSYRKDVGEQYPQEVVQLFVQHLDTFQSSNSNSGTHATIYSNNKPAKEVTVSDNPFGTNEAYKENDLEVNDNMLPEGFFGDVDND